MVFPIAVSILLASLVPDKTLVVAIQPFGNVPANSISAVESELVNVYGLEVKVLKSIPLPKEAFYSPRNRYRAEKLLTFLGETPVGYVKVIGITGRDISVTKDGNKDWGVFGYGQLPGRSCVLSSFRLRRRGLKTKNQRLTEVAIHEVGHTFGLPHCPTPKCVMADARGSIKTVDVSTGKLCQKCEEKL